MREDALFPFAPFPFPFVAFNCLTDFASGLGESEVFLFTPPVLVLGDPGAGGAELCAGRLLKEAVLGPLAGVGREGRDTTRFLVSTFIVRVTVAILIGAFPLPFPFVVGLVVLEEEEEEGEGA